MSPLTFPFKTLPAIRLDRRSVSERSTLVNCAESAAGHKLHCQQPQLQSGATGIVNRRGIGSNVRTRTRLKANNSRVRGLKVRFPHEFSQPTRNTKVFSLWLLVRTSPCSSPCKSTFFSALPRKTPWGQTSTLLNTWVPQTADYILVFLLSPLLFDEWSNYDFNCAPDVPFGQNPTKMKDCSKIRTIMRIYFYGFLVNNQRLFLAFELFLIKCRQNNLRIFDK